MARRGSPTTPMLAGWLRGGCRKPGAPNTLQQARSVAVVWCAKIPCRRQKTVNATWGCIKSSRGALPHVLCSADSAETTKRGAAAPPTAASASVLVRYPHFLADCYSYFFSRKSIFSLHRSTPDESCLLGGHVWCAGSHVVEFSGD